MTDQTEPDDSGPADLTGYLAPEPAIRCLTVTTAETTPTVEEPMTGQPITQEQTLKPTLGEQVTTLFARLADLNDQVAALRNPEWGARMGLLPKGHPLRPEQPDTSPEQQEQQTTPVDWEAIARRRERELKRVGEARHRAETELHWYAEAESADIAAGSYALRAERVEARLASVADLIADHEGDDWAAHPATTALRDILDDTAAPPAPAEVRDPCPRCESSSDRIPRRLMAEHVATVHPEVQVLDTTEEPATAPADAEAESADASVGSHALRAETALREVLAVLLPVRSGAEIIGYEPPLPIETTAIYRWQAAADEPRPQPGAWTPPPPGSTAEQLPPHILALIHAPSYVSTACDTAYALALPGHSHANIARRDEINEWVDRLHARCRRNQKFTGALCGCSCHITTKEN